MTSDKKLPALVRRPRPQNLFTAEEVALRCGVQVAYIERLYRLGIVSRHPDHEMYFPPDVTVTIRKIVRLRADLGVNEEGAAVIMDLLDRIEALEQELLLRGGTK
jgi:hypothetical protein